MAIKSSNPDDIDYSPGDKVTITERNKYKGTLFIEAYDNLIESIEAEAESTTEYALDITFNAIGAFSSTLSLVADPFAQLIGSALGWLMEHIDPLKKALDAVTGKPDEVRVYCEELKKQAAELVVLSEDHQEKFTTFTTWHGAAAEGFKVSMDLFTVELRRTADAIELNAKITNIGGMLVEVCRDIFRDMIAEFLGNLLSNAALGLASGLVTAGAGTAAAVGKLIARIAGFAGKLASRLAKIFKALAKLGLLKAKLENAFKLLKTNWGRFDNVADMMEITYEAKKAWDDVNKNTEEALDADWDLDEGIAKVKKESEEAQNTQTAYDSVKKAEGKEAKEAEQAGKDVEKEAKEAQDAGKKANEAADKAEKYSKDAEKYAKEAEKAAAAGDQKAFDAAKEKYEAAKSKFDDANAEFEKAKTKAEAEHTDLVNASEKLAKETKDVAEAAGKSYDKLLDSQTPYAEAEMASQEFKDKFGRKESEVPPEELEEFKAEQAAATDYAQKTATARQDHLAVESASKDFAEKNAAATEANAKALRTGKEEDIAAADKANEEAKTAGQTLQTAADKAKASGKDAQTAQTEYAKYDKPIKVDAIIKEPVKAL